MGSGDEKVKSWVFCCSVEQLLSTLAHPFGLPLCVCVCVCVCACARARALRIYLAVLSKFHWSIKKSLSLIRCLSYQFHLEYIGVATILFSLQATVTGQGCNCKRGKKSRFMGKGYQIDQTPGVTLLLSVYHIYEYESLWIMMQQNQDWYGTLLALYIIAE